MGEAVSYLQQFQEQDWKMLAQSLPGQTRVWKISCTDALSRLPTVPAVISLRLLCHDADKSVAQNAFAAATEMAGRCPENADCQSLLFALVQEARLLKQP